MTQTFADELFNNLSKLKGGYKLDEEKTITLECNIISTSIISTFYIYGLDYSIKSGTDKGNFTIGEKVAEIGISTVKASVGGDKTFLTFNFKDDKISGCMYMGGAYCVLTDSSDRNKITSKTFYSVSHPYPALFITSTNFNKNDTYDSKLNNAINEINTDILNEGVIYTIPEFVKE